MTKFEIQLITPEAVKSNQELLDNLNKQLKSIKDSDVAKKMSAVVKSMAPLPDDVATVTKEQLAQVKADKNELVKIRTNIQKGSKLTRDLQTNINRSLSSYEKALVEITDKEENKRKEFIKNVEEYHLQAERKKTLPEYKQRFVDAGMNFVDASGVVNVVIGASGGFEKYKNIDEYLLSLDTTQRETFYNQCLSEKLEQDRIDLEAQKEEDADRLVQKEREEKEDEVIAEQEKAQKAKEARIAQFDVRLAKLMDIGDDIPVSADIINAMENTEFDTYYNSRVADKNKADLAIIEKEKQDKIDKEKEEKRLFDEKLAKEKQDKIDKEKEEKAKLADEKYQEWLKTNTYNPDIDILNKENNETKLYKLISTYNHDR